MDWNVILEKALFYGLALATLGSAVVVTFGRNLVRSAFALFFTLMGMAGLFVFLAADFVAVMQVIVYVGGILVLILFGIWLTHRIMSLDIRATRVNFLPGIGVGLLLFGVLYFTIRSFDWTTFVPAPYRASARDIGRMLLSEYVLPFEVATIALCVALVGAVVIGRREIKP